MEEINVNGTLVWYYFVCKRQVWLMAHNILPNQDDENIKIGKLLHERSYQKDKKEISLGNVKIDVISKDKGYFMVGEVKKSSKYMKSAKMQLAYYLLELKRHGIDGYGMLMFPKERKKEEINLTDDLIKELEIIEIHIVKICSREFPPNVEKIPLCKNCGYIEFCWS
ncbi:CRISPR-associated protein Cas4 [Anaerosalibacter bizertensis]|uniref:CRISPR-associated protein Cas4 n=1 Tax=Anaerosalibacter bizertensis TaxID=932217 RepID=UPI001765ECB0|nr:CRISPR-associated protein Cas4 [Anaerosalibacter bizertensis]MBU5293793.1 CRISPR-associated protein Cas4 [Anaerosalibacter bizertensis]HHV26188.1 CRISPR-associated protein Cas4 [Tissierellia bacterium]